MTTLESSPLYFYLENTCDTPSFLNYDTTEFTSEEISKFQHRFEEGFDVPDARYEHWLQMYHPEAKLSNEGSSCNPLSVSSDCMQ